MKSKRGMSIKQMKFSEIPDNQNNVENLFRLLRRELEQILSISSGEATAMARLIFHALKGWDATALFCHYPDSLSPYILERIDQILDRLKAHEPIQYILGEGRFYGMDLKVNTSTLIPRPETEELVELIIDREGRTPDLRVLDVGTGSGAIAIALSRNLLFPKITAIDVSPQAIMVAKENALNLKADIDFITADIFAWPPAPDSLDIIVSNPPYIAESEKSDMEAHVLDYEPPTALFVPDSDPLRFYRRIAEAGASSLTTGGRIYFEINPLFTSQLEEMMQNLGYTDIALHSDISRRQRFLTATLGHEKR